MNMKRLLTLVAFFATLQASAQQVNPVPDYVFRNQMSVGRNAVTDTAAYFSIGPRYGATKGFMPPIVGDTATFSSGKRNGLLIFSVQKNKFLYWDSVGVKWAEMAGTGGSAIAGTGTTNYVPKFTGTTTIGNSRLFDNGINVGINTATPKYFTHINQASNNHAQYDARYKFILESDTAVYLGVSAKNNTYGGFRILDSTGAKGGVDYYNNLSQLDIFSSGVTSFRQTTTEAFRIFLNGRVAFNNTTDAGFQVDVNGTFRTVNGAVLASTSGNVGIGITPSGWSSVTALQIEQGALSADPANNIFNITNNVYYDGGANRYIQNGAVSFYQQFGGDHIFYSAGSGTAGNTVSLTRHATITTGGELWIGYASDQGTYVVQANGNALIAGNIRTAAPAGGTANDWRLGTVATVSPTSPNRTIEVSIGGTIYYIHAKTTND